MLSRPLSPSLRRQYEEFGRGDGTETWSAFARPQSSPAPSTDFQRSRPWTVVSVTSEDSKDLRREAKAKSLALKASNSCEEYRLSKREDDMKALQGLWSAMSFRRPRGMDVLHERARRLRRVLPATAEGFLETGPTQQTPYDIALQCPVLQKMEEELVTLSMRLVEADCLHFCSCAAGQVLYREKDPVENGYFLLSGSVQQFSKEHEFLRSQGWHRELDQDLEEKKLMARHASRYRESPRDEDPKHFVTLTEHVRKGGDLDDYEKRFRSLEGHSVFCQDTRHGELYATASSFGAVVGEQALRGEKLWRHSALCFRDCEFLVIDGTIFNHVLRTLQETLRFFELYLPGVRLVPKKERKRPDPIEYWKEEELAEGETLLEEGMDPLEPLVFMVLKGTLNLKRYRLPGSNPAYVLATQPLRGQRLQVNAKDVPSSLPDVARSFVEDLDEDGLPRMGLPPALKGSIRHKLESEYWADPVNFVPDVKRMSKQEIQKYQHKILAKERLETTATRRRERLLKREAAQKAAQAEARQGVEDPRSVADVRQLLEYLQSMNVARPGSPEYIGEDTWSEWPRPWLSMETSTGPISRPVSSQSLREETSKGSEQETVGVLKPGDLFCSLSFFPICGVPEPFSVVANQGCRVVVVRGLNEVKAIPRHILKETRVEIGRFLQKKLDGLVSASKDTGSESKVVPPLPTEPSELSETLGASVGTLGASVATSGRAPPVAVQRPLALEPEASEDESLRSFESFGHKPKARRVRKKRPKPSMARWLLIGTEKRWLAWWKR